MDELISAAEAAARLGVSKDWIVKLCQQGRIPGARKLGRKVNDPWLIPVGAKVLPPAAIGRPLRTTEIPRAGKKGGER